MIESLCRLPLAFRERRAVSYVDLLREIGYSAAEVPLSASELAGYLGEHPSLIDLWIAYSQDKRTSSGWYFERHGNKGYEVAHFPNGPRMLLDDSAQACAEFIIRELPELRPVAV